MPGSGEQWIDLLPTFLEVIVGAQDTDTTVAVPGFDEPMSVSDLAKKLGSSFVTRRDRRFVLADGVTQWLRSKDPQQLILHLHARVRLVGELLSMLKTSPLSHEELRVLANSQYGMNWTALDQLRRRTTWLRASGHVELYGGKVHLTAVGKTLLDWLPLNAPEPPNLEVEVTVSPAHPVIGELLGPLRDQDHHSRTDAKSLFLPSPEGVGPVAVLRDAVSSAIPEATEVGLEDLLRRYGLAEASARQARASLKMLGLIERVGLGRWAATPAAAAWLDDGDDTDLVRIVHANVWFVGEILSELRDGPADALALSERSANYSREAIRVPSMRTRFALLRECGVVDKFDHQRYQLTPAGKALLADLPVAARGEVATPTTLTAEPLPADEDPHVSSRLAEELIDSSRDSRHPTRFELAVHDALSFLHLHVEHLSGPTRTDVAATLLLPASKFVFAVEAKTSGEGPVSDREVSFQGLREHRDKIDATITVLVGPEFHRRIHAEAAADPHLAVLHARTLADAVLMHARTPFSPTELTVLFDTEITADQRDKELRHQHDEHLQLMTILKAVVTQLDLEMHDESPMYDGGWLGPNELRRDLRKLAVPHERIVEALQLLASPFIRVVEGHKGRYRLIGPAHLLTARLQAVIEHLQ
ncbi:hypothetical protein ACLMAL_36515 (plasmid) [Nocardia sp. CWNU-33]|uniref:hypothetical protein n=1 Tax=Nocardia sp. CWNU-33 TaxID=3392117 RepID=UPI00398E4854